MKKALLIIMCIFMLVSTAMGADKKISELDAVSALDGTEVAPVVQGTTTKKATIDEIMTYAKTMMVEGENKIVLNEGAPDANFDTPTYTIGDIVINTITSCAFIADDVTDGAAVWVSQCLGPLQQNYFWVGDANGTAAPTNVLPLAGISDNVYFENAADTTKRFEFDVSGVTTSTKRTLGVQDRDGTIDLTRPAEVIKTASATLTLAEVSGTFISNYGETDDADLILTITDLDAYPTANFIYRISAAMATNDTCIKAAADNAFMLGGSAGADNGCICNTSPTLGDKLTCAAWTTAAGAVVIDCEATGGTWSIVADNTGDCPD